MLSFTGVAITPERRVTDFGEGDWAPITAIANAVVVLDTPSASAQAVGSADPGKPYVQGGSLFVPRGSDLKDGDRIRYQGKTFGIVGDAQWDQNHAFSGQDLGVVEYTLRLGG